MCAEAVWWRCHRRIITDYLLAAGEITKSGAAAIGIAEDGGSADEPAPEPKRQGKAAAQKGKAAQAEAGVGRGGSKRAQIIALMQRKAIGCRHRRAYQQVQRRKESSGCAQATWPSADFGSGGRSPSRCPFPSRKPQSLGRGRGRAGRKAPAS